MTTLIVPRGKLWIGTYSGTTPPTDPAGYTFLGNCKDVGAQPQEEVLDHYDYTSGYRTRDEQVTLELKYTGSFVTDHISTANLAKFFSATIVGNEIRAFQAIANRYSLKFVTDNPIGPNMTYKFNKVKLTPNGDFKLVVEEWQEMNFSFEGLADTTNFSSSPYITITYTTTTSTTSTTTTSTTSG